MSERDEMMRRGMAKVLADQGTSDPDAQPCQSQPMIHFDAYRIGGRQRRPHWAHRWHVDRWFRSWQCEWEVIYGIVVDECMSCPRAWTERGALRRGRRWYRRGTDVGRSRRRRLTLDEAGGS
jgi:hypothetical protein